MPYAKTSQRAEKRALRERMRGLGLGYREIAVEFARRYRLRPRAAWREAYGWSQTEAAYQINTHTGQVGLDPDGISAMSASHLCEYENWPGEGPEPTGRRPSPYLLALLAAVYGCAVQELIDLADREHLPPADLLVLDKYGQNRPAADPHAPPALAALARSVAQPQPIAPMAEDDERPALALRRLDALNVTPSPVVPTMLTVPGDAYLGITPDVGASGVEREVLMAAHEGSDYAERAEQRDIGEATLDQLRADVVQLSRECDTGEPFLVFLETRRVRSRMHAALDRRLWPRDQAELYLLLGCINGMMGVSADRLGYASAGEELIRAGWAYATAIDHRPLQGQLRQQLAAMAYRSGRLRQSRDLAASGLRYLSKGPNGANLHLKYAVAAARLGDAGAARRAVADAHEAREHEHHDELLEIGGEFAISRATHHYFAGAAFGEINGAAQQAAAELERAVGLYEAGPGPREEHWFGAKALANIDLAVIRLRTAALDAAAAALEPVLSLPPGQRITSLRGRLDRVRAELARERYQGSPRAQNLDEQIEEFGRDTIVGVLHDLPAGGG